MPFNQFGIDPYGVSKHHLGIFMTMLEVFYRHYFRVRSFGIEHMPKRGRGMLVGNHSGGVAVDGAMVIASMFLEMDPPRLAQGMAEKFINQLPFAAVVEPHRPVHRPARARRCGCSRRPAAHGLPRGRARHRQAVQGALPLVDFGTGFIRLALQTGTPIVPLAFIGGGDGHAHRVPTSTGSGRLFGVPYRPVTPYLLPCRCPLRWRSTTASRCTSRAPATRTTTSSRATSSRSRAHRRLVAAARQQRARGPSRRRRA